MGADASKSDRTDILRIDGIDPEGAHRDVIMPVLQQLQGNILKGHGRDHTVHYFFQFTGQAEQNRVLLRALSFQVTSAWQQRLDIQASRGNGPKFLRFCNLFLTARGYTALGYNPDDLGKQLPEDAGSQPGSRAITFKDGMACHRDALADPPLDEWEPGYAGPGGGNPQVIDGMVLLANDALDGLNDHEAGLCEVLAGRARILVVERGRALFNQDRTQNLEHFGYVDGRSQPLFFKDDIDRESAREGIDTWDPRATLDLVLVPDGLARGAAPNTCFGSYLVFRKLEQNVKAFKAAEGLLANELGLKGEHEELVGALAVGRFEDGTPVVLRPFDGLDSPVPNNFTFAATDPHGLRCPFQAHIRKINPRGETGDQQERRHRIVRRGITYGIRAVEPKDHPREEDLPEGGVGLLFMCFQSSIDNQFAYLQRRFANDEEFPRDHTGIDPIIGQSGGANRAVQRWPVHWGDAYSRGSFFGGFVRLLGGDFFFAPSMAFLRDPPDPVSLRTRPSEAGT